MADKPSQNQAGATNPAGDPLFNLKFAQAEAELEQSPAGSAANDDPLAGEDDELDEGPRDRQGQRRGENDPTDLSGSTAGTHS